MRGRGRPQSASRWAAPQMTGAQHESQLIALLYQCRPHRLDEFTVDELLRTHSKVPRQKVEYLLQIARQKRSGEARDR